MRLELQPQHIREGFAGAAVAFSAAGSVTATEAGSAAEPPLTGSGSAAMTRATGLASSLTQRCVCGAEGGDVSIHARRREFAVVCGS